MQSSGPRRTAICKLMVRIGLLAGFSSNAGAARTQNRLHEKTNFPSRFNPIARSSPARKNIPLSYFRKS